MNLRPKESKFYLDLVVASMILPAGLALNFFMHVVLARVLTINDFGIISVVISMCNILACGLTLGFATSLLKFIPQYQIVNDHFSISGLLKFSFLLISVISVGVQILLFLVSMSIYGENTKIVLMLISILILPISIDLWRESVIRSFRFVVQSILPKQVIAPLIVIFVAIYFDHLNATNTITIYSLSITVLFVFSITFFFKKINYSKEYNVQKYRSKEWLHTSLPMLFINLAKVGITRWDIIFIAILLNYQSAGVYAAAAKIAFLVSIILRIIELVAAPLISHSFHAKNNIEVSRLLNFSMVSGVIIGVPVFIIISFNAAYILEIFGGNFIVGETVLKILIIGQLINLITGPGGIVLQMIGKERVQARIIFIAAIISITLNLILIKYFGLIGAASATTIVLVCQNIVTLFIARKALK